MIEREMSNRELERKILREVVFRYEDIKQQIDTVNNNKYRYVGATLKTKYCPIFITWDNKKRTIDFIEYHVEPEHGILKEAKYISAGNKHKERIPLPAKDIKVDKGGKSDKVVIESTSIELLIDYANSCFSKGYKVAKEIHKKWKWLRFDYIFRIVLIRREADK